MTDLWILRHGPTDWNESGRIQGHTDRPLTAEARAWIPSWRLPPEAEGLPWVSSPLIRALETARLMGADPVLEPRLAEAHWGDWQGRTLAELREELGDGMAANEARGLDFRPPGGESPRDMQARIRPWLAELARDRRSVVAASHRGLIRALMALALGWDMLGKPPVKLNRRDAIHHFRLAADGHPTVVRMNIPLTDDP
ncbi:MAG: histidine phosphatase family protein [Rhodobacterales bacterium]|nr:histidine phosphatase family protein [Rhodobacterales bacterium]